eukprot:3935084-Rhodomonas_salina.1
MACTKLGALALAALLRRGHDEYMSHDNSQPSPQVQAPAHTRVHTRAHVHTSHTCTHTRTRTHAHTLDKHMSRDHSY